MSGASPRPPQLRGRIFRGQDAIQAGLLTKDNLRSRTWRRVFRGIYADARMVDCGSYRQLCLAAAWYLLPAPAAIAGQSAAGEPVRDRGGGPVQGRYGRRRCPRSV